MRDQVLRVLSTLPQKAGDIRRALQIPGTTKSDVNRVLYALQTEGLAQRNDDFEWVLTGETSGEPSDDQLDQEAMDAEMSGISAHQRHLDHLGVWGTD